MAKQGKCMTCRIRWVWDREIRKSFLRCPKCGENFNSTTHILQWPMKEAKVITINLPSGFKRYGLSPIVTKEDRDALVNAVDRMVEGTSK